MNISKKSIILLLQIIAMPAILFLFVACNQHKTKNIQATKENQPTATKSRDSTVVFSRIDQGEVMINKEYCNQLDDATRAILFYYASKFNTGFDSANNSLLTVALESKGKPSDGKKLIEKWFKDADLVKLKKANVSAVLPDGASNSTWFTLIAVVKDKDMRRIYFRTLDTENEKKYREATDLFKISGDHIRVLEVHDFGDLSK